MPDLKISQYSPITSLADTDELIVASSGTTKKVNGSNLKQTFGVDPVQETLGAPNTAFEFNTNSLSGLTALGAAPAVEDAHTTVPGHYYIRDAGANWVGRYVAATPPFTAITKLERMVRDVDGSKAGLFISDSSPSNPFSGDGDAIVIGNSGRAVWVELVQTTNITSTGGGIPLLGYLAIRVNSTTDIDYLYSNNGRIWAKIVDSRNPSVFTAATCGIGIAPGSSHLSAAFDFLRIWNSAIALPGALA